MKAVESFEKSNLNQAASKDLSKREHTTPTRGNDGMYARLRRLELRLNQIESVVSTTRRDVYRIEKKQQRDLRLPSAAQDTLVQAASRDDKGLIIPGFEGLWG